MSVVLQQTTNNTPVTNYSMIISLKLSRNANIENINMLETLIKSMIL